MVLAIPEDMLRDEVEALDRPRVPPVAETPDPGAIAAMFDLLKDAAAPVAIVGGADWSPCAAHHCANFAFRHGIPTAAAFRRQDAVDNSCGVYAGQLGYGPNPKLQQRVRDADLLIVVGARLGEATTDGYKLVTPDHPGQILVHVHPDPNELGRVYHADLPICADMSEFARDGRRMERPRARPLLAPARKPTSEWLDWSEPKPRKGVKLDLGPCVKAMRDTLPADIDHLQRRRQFLRLVAPLLALWRPAVAARADQRHDGLRPARRGRRRAPLPATAPVVCVAGDGDFLMNGQELATAAPIWRRPARHPRRQRQLRHDPHAPGARLSRSGSARPTSPTPTSPRSPRPMAAGPRRSSAPTTSPPRSTAAMKRKGIRLIHCKTDVELISNATTIAKLRAR